MTCPAPHTITLISPTDSGPAVVGSYSACFAPSVAVHSAELAAASSSFAEEDHSEAFAENLGLAPGLGFVLGPAPALDLAAAAAVVFVFVLQRVVAPAPLALDCSLAFVPLSSDPPLGIMPATSCTAFSESQLCSPRLLAS